MKIQHYAIIFIIIILPFSIICKSKINNKIDVLNNETRINNALDVATTDAVDTLIDLNDEYYALYDGEMLDVTPTIAKEGIKTFFQSLSVNNNLPFTSGDKLGEEYFSPYIPAILVIAYDGFYIYSVEETNTGIYEYVLSPKIPYAYEENGYYINFTLGNYIKLYAPNGILYKGALTKNYLANTSGEYMKMAEILEGNPNANLSNDNVKDLSNLTDDMSLILYALNKASASIGILPSFLTSTTKPMLKDYNVGTSGDNASDFHKIRRETIINLIVDTLNEKINSHNRYADMMGITYDFFLPEIENAQWINAVDDISIMAFVQGIPTGHETYYNSYALGSSRIIRTDFVYGTANDKLYHNSNCEHMIGKLDNDGYPFEHITDIDNMFLNEIDAALGGYHPCVGDKVYREFAYVDDDIYVFTPKPPDYVGDDDDDSDDDTPGDGECEHDWKEEVILYPTTQSEGLKRFTCEKCGETREQVIPTIECEHRWGENIIWKQATCEEVGIGFKVCDKCGASIDVTIDTLDHDWGPWQWWLFTKKRTCKICNKTEEKYWWD